MKPDYVARINRAIDHITQHLDGPLKLEDVARVACLSPYHFHRIFRQLVGETLHTFTKRVRLERAVYLLSHRDHTTLTEIALACGFTSSSDFSRCFSGHFGCPPRAFDVDAYRRSRRDEMLDALPSEPQRQRLERLPRGQNPDQFSVRLCAQPARRVAYLRVHRPFEPGNVTGAAARLVAWAKERRVADGQWLGYMWDDPEITAIERCRYDVGVEVPTSQVADDIVSVMDFPPMTLAEIDIAGPIDLEQRALDWLYGTWLPESGYAPDHQPAFEAWNGEPFAHGDAYFELRVQLAVVDATVPL